MKTIITIIVLAASIAVAQECLHSRQPLSAMKANFVGIKFPADGGSRPCFGYATIPTGGENPNEYQMSNTDCDRLKRLGDWAVQQDNGWSDGGLP